MSTRCARVLALVAAGLLLTCGLAATAGAAARPIPVLAYYYIWYNPESWNRAKIDYPLLGRYSSDDTSVLEQHVRWAQYAGIDGFIVSWKHTPALDARLRKLIAIADRLDFKLAIIYQGLDFYRRPLPVGRVAGDLRFFESHFASDPAFASLRSRSSSGPGRGSSPPTESGRQPAPCATSSSCSRRRRTSTATTGSPAPSTATRTTGRRSTRDTYTDYAGKLADDGDRCAPRRRALDRAGRARLRRAPGRRASSLRAVVVRRCAREFAAAEQSSPDAVGLISWNEFSENSQVEPSRRFGKTYLNVLRDVLGGPAPTVSGLNSDNRRRAGTTTGSASQAASAAP